LWRQRYAQAGVGGLLRDAPRPGRRKRRLSLLQSNGANYLSGVTYNAAHAPTALTIGTSIQASVGYNSRMQLQSLAYSTGSTSILNLAYGYATPNGSNNGQIASVTDSTDTQKAGRTATYTYDAWARLKTMLTNGSTSYPQVSLSWDYDRYGNRKAQNGTNSMQLTISTTTNRVTQIGSIGTEHDLAGNLTKDDLRRYVLDGENREAKLRDLANTQDLAVYTYDGNGLRVKKQVGTGTPTVYIFSGSVVVAEYAAGAAPSSPQAEYVYSGSGLLATIVAGAVFAAGDSGPADPELCPPWHHHAACRAQRAGGNGDRYLLAATAAQPVPDGLGADRAGRAAPAGHPFDPGQPRHAHASQGAGLVGRSSALPCALHSDRRVLAEPGGTLVRGNHPPAHSARDVSKCSRTEPRHFPIPSREQPESSPVHLNSDRFQDHEEDQTS